MPNKPAGTVVRITPEQDAALQVLRSRSNPISAGDLREVLFVAGITSAKGRGVVNDWLRGLSDVGLARWIDVEPSGGCRRRMWSVSTGVRRLRGCVYQLRTTKRSFVIDQD